MFKPFPREVERDRERVLAEERDTGTLERPRTPLSRMDMLEKDGCRPREWLCTEKLEVMVLAEPATFCTVCVLLVKKYVLLVSLKAACSLIPCENHEKPEYQ